MYIFAILGLFLLGIIIGKILNRNINFMESFGLGFLLGIQIFTLVLFVINYYFGVKLNFVSCWLTLLAILTAAYFITGFKLTHPNFKNISLPKSKFSKALVLILTLLIGSNLTVSFWRPVVDWDAVNMFDYRAKIILHTGWIKDTQFRASFTSYPLFTTLSHYWLEVNQAPTAMPIYSILYGSFILVSYSLLRRLFSQGPALLGILFLATAPKMFDQSLIAYTNLPYTIYLILGAVYLFYWTKTKNKSDLILGILLSLFSFWVRTFPFAVANIVTVLFLFSKTRKPTIIIGIFAGLILIAKFFWPINLSQLAGTLTFTKWAVIFYYSPYTWIFILLTIHSIFNRPENKYWLVTIVLYFLIYISGNYYFAGINPDFAGIPDAAQRMTMFLSPAVLWLVFSYLSDNGIMAFLKPHNT